MKPQPLILIPARLASARLPGKPLADIAGAPMIVHVWRAARAAELGPVWVATDSPEIVAAVESCGGRAILTSERHRTGSDRIAEALALIDPERRHDVVINLQGDEPFIDPQAIRAAAALMADERVDLGTLACPLRNPEDLTDPACVKMIATAIAPHRLRVHYFTRARLYGEGADYRHIGLYAWRRRALSRFAAAPPSPLEMRENLEQLRALEDFMRIEAALVEDAPRGVDTAEDLARARDFASLRAPA